MSAAISRSLARSILSSGALCFAGDGCGTSRSGVPRAAAKALPSQRRAAERSVETPAKRNNSSIVPSPGNLVGMRLKSDSTHTQGRGSPPGLRILNPCSLLWNGPVWRGEKSWNGVAILGHNCSRPCRRNGSCRSRRGSREVWLRASAGSGFHRLARRSLRQGARCTWGRSNWCCNSAAELWQSRSRASCGAIPRNSDSLRLFTSITTMNRKAPLPNVRSQRPTWNKAAALARPVSTRVNKPENDDASLLESAA